MHRVPAGLLASHQIDPNEPEEPTSEDGDQLKDDWVSFLFHNAEGMRVDQRVALLGVVISRLVGPSFNREFSACVGIEFVVSGKCLTCL